MCSSIRPAEWSTQTWPELQTAPRPMKMERAAGIERSAKALAVGESFMRSLWRMIDQERYRREREAERAHQRWLRGDDEHER